MTKLKLEVGKYYRTRDGRKASDVGLYEGGTWQALIDDDEEGCGARLFHRNGAHWFGESDLDLIAEWTDTPTIGTLAEIGAQVGDVVEFVEWGFDTTYTRAIGTHYKHCGEKLVSDIGTYFHYGDAIEHKWRIISRASDAKSPVELSVDLGEAIKQVVAESQSGPVQLRKVIVPGVYGKVYVHGHVDDGCDIYVRLTDETDDRFLDGFGCAVMTRDDLTEAIATLTAIRDAL